MQKPELIIFSMASIQLDHLFITKIDLNPPLLTNFGIFNRKQFQPTHVARWVELVCGSSEIGAKFLEQEIDGDSLLLVDESVLKQDLGLKLGPYMKIMKDLKKIKSLS